MPYQNQNNKILTKEVQNIFNNKDVYIHSINGEPGFINLLLCRETNCNLSKQFFDIENKKYVKYPIEKLSYENESIQNNLQTKNNFIQHMKDVYKDFCDGKVTYIPEEKVEVFCKAMINQCPQKNKK